MIPAFFAFDVDGCWDQGLCSALVDGDLWGFGGEFYRLPWNEHSGIGGILVASGGVCRGRQEELLDFISRMPWVVYFHTGDEMLTFDSRSLLEATGTPYVLFMQCPRPQAKLQGDHNMFMGWQRDVRGSLAGRPMLPLSERPYRWSFAGQVNNPKRSECLSAIRSLDQSGGRLAVSDGFADEAIPRHDYHAMMLMTRIAPCPSGSYSPESFRFYEALEAGCLPIVDSVAPSNDVDGDWPAGYRYFSAGSLVQTDFFTGCPAPSVSAWPELGGLVEHYDANPVRLQGDANLAGAWWIREKRDFAKLVPRVARELSGDNRSRPPCDEITIVIPSSPIPSHPSTEYLDTTVGKLRSYEELSECDVIIMLDGLRPEQQHYEEAYEEYRRRVVQLCSRDERYRGCIPVVFEEHLHQAEMTRRCLELVDTDLVMFVEHDTWPVGDIDFCSIAETIIDTDDVDVVRLHIFDKVLLEHRYLYSDEPRVDDVAAPILRTKQWSQRPHLAKTEFYRKILTDHFHPLDRTMIEDKFHSVLQERTGRNYGVYIYHPREGGLLRSGTVDGRQGDPKFPMYWHGGVSEDQG